MLEQLPRTERGFIGGQSDYDEFRQLLYAVVDKYKPMTVRQVFYQAVVRNYVEKTEKGYGMIQRDLANMRRNGELPYEWIIDSSRNVRGWQGSNQSVEDFITSLPERIPYMHTRDLLADNHISVQVWLEKEALAEVVYPICQKWDVPLFCARGYASLSFLHEAAKDLESKDRPTVILHLGDYDPSGQNAIETVQRDLPELAPKTAEHGFEFDIIAVTPEQIVELGLPTRPTKKSDTRSAGFGDKSVELDAIEPNVLRAMVDETLERAFPEGAREANEEQEARERDQIRELVKGWIAK
jgi:hypothetical protein